MNGANSPATPADWFREAVRLAKTQANLAAICGSSQPSISKRLRARKPAEPEEVLLIERELGISRHDLRPDIYPREAPAAAATPDRFEAAR